MKKRCCCCHEIKAISCFCKDSNRKDGIYPYCRECRKVKGREYRKTKSYAHTRRKYERSEKGRAALSRYSKSQKGKKTSAKYKASQKGQDSRRRSRIAYRLAHLAKYKAHQKVASAIQRGAIFRASEYKCSDCEAQASEYHHYLGYAEEHWFDIYPICRSCHKNTHL